MNRTMFSALLKSAKTAFLFSIVVFAVLLILSFDDTTSIELLRIGAMALSAGILFVPVSALASKYSGRRHDK